MLAIETDSQNTPHTSISSVQSFILELSKIECNQDFRDFWDRNKSTPEEINLAWQQCPRQIKSRIIALCNGDIFYTIKIRPRELPVWCNYNLGQLLWYQKKLCWFINIPEIVGDPKKEIIPPRLMSSNCLELQLVGAVKRLFIVPIEEVEPYE